MYKRNEILTLDDNKDYCVLDSINLDNNEYVCLFEVKNPINTMYMKVDKDELVVVRDEEEIKKILEILAQRF